MSTETKLGVVEGFETVRFIRDNLKRATVKAAMVGPQCMALGQRQLSRRRVGECEGLILEPAALIWTRYIIRDSKPFKFPHCTTSVLFFSYMYPSWTVRSICWMVGVKKLLMLRMPQGLVLVPSLFQVMTSKTRDRTVAAEEGERLRHGAMS